MARTPVTNGQFVQFVGDGGYHREEFWSADGWQPLHLASFFGRG